MLTVADPLLLIEVGIGIALYPKMENVSKLDPGSESEPGPGTEPTSKWAQRKRKQNDKC